MEEESMKLALKAVDGYQDYSISSSTHALQLKVFGCNI
jgi:hypothetical protein